MMQAVIKATKVAILAVRKAKDQTKTTSLAPAMLKTVFQC